MQINTEFWGSPETWADATDSIERTAEIKQIDWNTNTNRYEWAGGYLASGENRYKFMDPPLPEVTPTAWGINKNSALANPLYGFIGYDGALLEPRYSAVTPYTREMRKESKTLDFCPQHFTYGGTGVFGWSNRIWSEEGIPVTQTNQSNCACGGILSFNYQNIIVHPALRIAKRVPFSSSNRYGLQEFASPVTIDEFFTGGTNRFPQPAKNEYPLILAVVVNKWYLGGQPVYSGGEYVSGQRQSKVSDYFTMRFNESLKGLEYFQSVSMKYQGNEETREPKILGDYFTLYPCILHNANISGYYYNSMGWTQNILTETDADTEEKAWALSTTGNYPTILQNGKYTVEGIQGQNDNQTTTYYNSFMLVAVWDTENVETTKDDILRDVAYLGFWFSEDETTCRRALTGENCNDSKMHIPVFDSKGVTTGEWKSGTDAALESNAKWGNPFNDSPYNPQGGGGDDDFGDLNNSIYRGINFYNLKMYALTETMLQSFLAAVNAMYTGDGNTTQMELDFKGSNPNDYIVGLYGYPFDIPYNATPTNIFLGPVNTGVSACIAESQAWGALTFDSVYINSYYDDFRDFEPYTTIELYLPLCGSVRLDPALYIGHHLNVEYDFDPMTGNLSAKIMRDNMIDKIVEGSIAVQIPVTAANMGDYQRSIHQIKSRIMQSAFSTIQSLSPSSSFKSAAASQNTSGMLASIPDPFKIGMDIVSDVYDIGYDLKHTQPHVSVTGSSDPLNAMNMDNHIYVFIKRAKMQSGYDANIYSHTVGNACLIQSKIKDMSGLIKCSNVDLSGIPATAEEINAIQTALQNGVYV